MKFSIIIPAYNEEKYITPCLRSVSLLHIPADGSFEVIVVNNASTDKTAEVARAALPEAKIINEPRKGLTRAYNRGAEEAKGEILVFIDADMILPPRHLERISKEFKKDPKLVALSGPCFLKDGGLWYDLITRLIFLFIAMPAEILFNRLLNVGVDVASGNLAVKKEFFNKAGGFDENIFYGLDAEFALRMKKLGKVRFKHRFAIKGSSRRFKKEGLFLVPWRYTLNGMWFHLFHKPFNKNYIDVR